MICQRCGTTNEGSDPWCRVCGAVLMPCLASAQMKETPVALPGTSQPLTRSWTPLVGATGKLARYQQISEESWIEPSIAQSIRATPPLKGSAMPAQPLAVRNRRWRWLWYLLFILAVLGIIVSAGWLVLVRPIVHQAVDEQIRHGLQRAVEDIAPLAAVGPAEVPFPVTEQALNTYIAQHTDQLAPITQMHVSLQPEVMVVTFQTYGFGSTIRLGLSVVAGQLVAQNVDVSGLLWWVESPAELTPRLNQALSQVPGKVRRTFSSVSITAGVILLLFG